MRTLRVATGWAVTFLLHLDASEDNGEHHHRAEFRVYEGDGVWNLFPPLLAVDFVFIAFFYGFLLIKYGFDNVHRNPLS